MRRGTIAALGWLGTSGGTVAWAQGKLPSPAESFGLLGMLLLFYLLLAGWALFGVALMSGRVGMQVDALRRRGSACFWVGLGVFLAGIVTLVLLGSVGEALKKQGQAPALAGLLGLLFLVVLLAWITLVLIGWGGTSLLLGEAIGRIFGREDLSLGTTALLGALLPVLIGWVPVFGWALLLYWLCLSIGSVFVRAPTPGSSE